MKYTFHSYTLRPLDAVELLSLTSNLNDDAFYSIIHVGTFAVPLSTPCP